MADDVTMPETDAGGTPEAATPETPVTPTITPEALAALQASADQGKRAHEDLQRLNANYQRVAAQDPKMAAIIEAAISGRPYEHLLTDPKPVTPPDPLADPPAPLTREEIRVLVQEEARRQAAPLLSQIQSLSSETQFEKLTKAWGEEEVKQTAPLLNELLASDLSLARTLGPERAFKLAHHDRLAQENVRLKAELEKVRVKKVGQVAGTPAALGDRLPLPPNLKGNPKAIWEFHLRNSGLDQKE